MSRSDVGAANAAAAFSTTNILAAGTDDVSAAIAELFAGHGLEYQAVSAELEQFYQQFVHTLNAAGGAYALAEYENAEQAVLNVINAPTMTLLGRPLIGNGANATTAAPADRTVSQQQRLARESPTPQPVKRRG